MEKVSKKIRRETVDIVGELVSKIDTSVYITEVVDNNDGTYTLSTCNSKYLKPCVKFDYNGVTYTVIDEVGKEFNPNKNFTVKGLAIPVIGTIVLSPMKYYHGTVMATTAELDKKKFDTEKFPMVYLLEVIRDDFNNKIEDRIDRISSLRMFFLTNTDEENWLTDDQYRLAIKPMRNMVYEFIELIDNNEEIGDIDDYRAINHARFGVYSTDKGHTRRVFNDQTSGTELVVDLPVIKGSLCIDCC